MTEISLCGSTGYTTQTHCQDWNIYISKFTATRLSSKTKYLQRSFSMKNGWSTGQQCINPIWATIQCAFWVFRVDLLYKISLPPNPHPFCHFTSLSQSLIFLLSFPARPRLFIQYLPSISQTFPYSVLPLTSLLRYKAAPSSSLPDILALFLYISLAREANEGRVFTASHSPTPPSVQTPHKSASQHATGTKLECPALMCPPRPLQEPTVSFANTHTQMNAHILYDKMRDDQVYDSDRSP